MTSSQLMNPSVIGMAGPKIQSLQHPHSYPGSFHPMMEMAYVLLLGTDPNLLQTEQNLKKQITVISVKEPSEIRSDAHRHAVYLIITECTGCYLISSSI